MAWQCQGQGACACACACARACAGACACACACACVFLLVTPFRLVLVWVCCRVRVRVCSFRSPCFVWFSFGCAAARGSPVITSAHELDILTAVAPAAQNAFAAHLRSCTGYEAEVRVVHHGGRFLAAAHLSVRGVLSPAWQHAMSFVPGVRLRRLLAERRRRGQQPLLASCMMTRRTDLGSRALKSTCRALARMNRSSNGTCDTRTTGAATPGLKSPTRWRWR